MTLPTDIKDREFQKFEEDLDGYVAVRTIEKDDKAFFESTKGDSLRTSNADVESKLELVLIELKKMNVQLALLTDNELKEADTK